MNDFSPKRLRKHILDMAYHGQTAHVGCALSIVPILSELFTSRLKPGDQLILSKGHGVMALYACLIEQGKISLDEVATYQKDGTRLFGCAEAGVHGILATTGSMGHGFPIAVGMALGFRRLGVHNHVYCIVGDGEMQTGSCMEAADFAWREQLTNLHIIVDQNDFQAMGPIPRISGDSFQPEWRNTVKGDGVSFMENNNEWHYRRLTKDEYEKALKEIGYP